MNIKERLQEINRLSYCISDLSLCIGREQNEQESGALCNAVGIMADKISTLADEAIHQEETIDPEKLKLIASLAREFKGAAND